MVTLYLEGNLHSSCFFELLMTVLKYLIGSLAVSCLLCCSVGALYAQGSEKGNIFEGVVQLDKTVHDFGDIFISDGPVSATFTVKNLSDKALLTHNVAVSCGCTNVEWTKSPIEPGKTGTIKATFRNDEGYPFDKSVTAYFSGMKKPVVLRLRGVSHKTKLSLEELYQFRFGDLAMKKVEIKGGNLLQEKQKSGEVVVANLGNNPAKISFSDVSENLSVKLTPNPIPARSTAKLYYTVTADREHWGKNCYYATPKVNGKVHHAVFVQSAAENVSNREEESSGYRNPELGEGKNKIGIIAYIKEDFSGLSEEEKNNGSSPIADRSSDWIGEFKSGDQIKCKFNFENRGKAPLKIYKVDSDNALVHFETFKELAQGEKEDLNISIDTTGMPVGNCMITLTLTTNSPLRPMMNIYLTGSVIE